MNFLPFIVSWAVLAVIVIGLFLYRHWLESHEDHYVHLHGDVHDTAIVTTQSASIKHMAAVDKVKDKLLIAAIVYAVAIAIAGGYLAWNTPGV
ncbi:MAG TPA: hypothetical protein VF283_02680 [Bryobacteraceae bacterium]